MARLGLPDLGLGLGLRATHYRHLLETSPQVAVFELLTENFLESAGRPIEVIDQLAPRQPVVMHGVALGIGSTARLDIGYLRAVCALRDRVRAHWVSDHLCFTGVTGANSHDLLPLPYTETCLAHVSDRVRAVQDALGAPLVLENPSTYVGWPESTMPEWVFLQRLCADTGCGLLLDVNNIHVSARNLGFLPDDYLAGVPWDHVVQLHVAGHADHGTHCVDTHDRKPLASVWKLLGEAWRRASGATVILEWDADIPPFPELHRLARSAGRHLAQP
jgi:uncharacterized protein (UPF0276 family)